MVMEKTDNLGNFEQLVLTSVMWLGEDAYGIAIHGKVSELANKPMNLGSVYVTLDRLEKKGYIISRLIEPPPGRRGQARRYYRMKADGVRVLQESMALTKRVFDEFLKARRRGKWKLARSK
jgi:DNA-binding PadR family transcriptional regulator